MKLSDYKLLKKSYSVRKLFDIFSNSSFVLVLHFDSIKNNSFKLLKKQMESKGVSVFLLNKDDFLNLPVGFISRGSSVLFYSSSYFFFSELNEFFQKNNLTLNLLYFKYYYPVSGIYMDQLFHKYSMSSFNVNNFLFFTLNSYKNLFMMKNFFLAVQQGKLVNLLNHKVFNLFFLLNIILEKKKSFELKK